MSEIVHQRCFNHAGREAVARCPECRRYYCRECVSEHEGRVLCAACLAENAGPAEKTRRRLPVALVVKTAAMLVVIIGLYAAFWSLGRAILETPDGFHNGAVFRGESVGDP